MRVIIRPDYDKCSVWAANYIAYKINGFRPTAERPFVLGLPTGSTPLGTYRELIKLYQAGKLSFENVITFNMDEYIGLDEKHPQSYHYFMWENFFKHINIKKENINMLDGMTKMIPSAEVGFLGMKRDEENPTQQITYANRLPEDLTGRQCFLIDPMLATGGTLVAATHYLAERGAKDITAVCILGAPEGLKFVEENLDPSIKFKLVLCAVDEKLNDKCYIVPGLGDAGDRLYGVID